MKNSWLIISFFCLALPSQAEVSVDFLTQQGSKTLKTWSNSDLKSITKKEEISAQKLIIDDSTQSLDLNDRADIDLITFYTRANNTDVMIARIPRFMVWRGFFKLKFKNNELSGHAIKSRLLVPVAALELKNISKIELAKAAQVYPGTRIKLRTNPAASRGEKLFSQSCLACHSLPSVKALDPTQLTQTNLHRFHEFHQRYPGFEIDNRAIRGLIAYSEALASEKNEVKPHP